MSNAANGRLNHIIFLPFHMQTKRYRQYFHFVLSKHSETVFLFYIFLQNFCWIASNALKSAEIYKYYLLFFNTSESHQIGMKFCFLHIFQIIWGLQSSCFYLLSLQFQSSCVAIWRKTHRYLSQITSQLDAYYGVIWRKSHGFSAWFHLAFCMKFCNILIVSILQNGLKTCVFWMVVNLILILPVM